MATRRDGSGLNFIQHEANLPQNRNNRPVTSREPVFEPINFIEHEGNLPENSDQRPQPAPAAPATKDPGAPSPAARASHRTWARKLRWRYAKARSFDWSHLMYLVESRLEVAADEGINFVHVHLKDIPHKATMAEFVRALNEKYTGELEFSAEMDSTGTVAKLTWTEV